ncbi:glycosyltransferase family 4 protein [Candidatus Kuenenbacteria bacterium]|nr:glycosyltransferase family 4 protein [Candidatus Kuenenbacteria bacterium]
MAQKNQKVLIFSLTYLPFIGGAEIAVQEITKRLVGDFEFEMITCNLDGKQKDEEQLGNVKVYRIGKGRIGKHLFHLLAFKKALELHRKNNYSGVWSIMANRAGLAALSFKKKFPNVKFLLTLQEGDSVFDIWKKTWYMRPLYKNIYRRADYIQVISNFLAKRARKYGYKKEISVVPNGVDIEKFKNQNSKIKIKENLNIGPEEKIILTDSRLVKKNGVADLIKAFQLLVTPASPSARFDSARREAGRANYELRVTLLILGAGPLANQLKSLAVKLGLQDKIIFLGAIPYDQIQNYYSIADVFVRPSLTEGFGNVFVQAMAAKIPVVATPVGGIIDFLKDGETGWFCQPKNPESIADKIRYILAEKNTDEVSRVVETAQKMVIEKYTWDSVAQKMRNIFNSLIF